MTAAVEIGGTVKATFHGWKRQDQSLSLCLTCTKTMTATTAGVMATGLVTKNARSMINGKQITRRRQKLLRGSALVLSTTLTRCCPLESITLHPSRHPRLSRNRRKTPGPGPKLQGAWPATSKIADQGGAVPAPDRHLSGGCRPYGQWSRLQLHSRDRSKTTWIRTKL